MEILVTAAILWLVTVLLLDHHLRLIRRELQKMSWYAEKLYPSKKTEKPQTKS